MSEPSEIVFQIFFVGTDLLINPDRFSLYLGVLGFGWKKFLGRKKFRKNIKK